MKSVWDFVASVRNQKAVSLRFSPSHPVEYRIGRNWTPHPWEQGNFKESDFITPHLSQDQRRRLESERTLSGVLTSPQFSLRYQVFKTELGLSGTVDWLNDEVSLSEWALPPFFLEKVQKQSGLTLIYGPPNSGKSTLLNLIAQELKTSSRRSLYFTDSESGPGLRSRVLFELKNPGLGGEILIVDSALPEVQRKAFDLAIEGASVVTMVSAASIRAAFYLWMDKLGGNPTLLWPLVAENFICSLGLRLAPGLESVYQPVYEMLINTNEVKTLISQGSVHGLVEVMAKGGDKSGMRTMNQALLQLLLKRKIELRVGFEESSDPIELDALLKKVGI